MNYVGTNHQIPDFPFDALPYGDSGTYVDSSGTPQAFTFGQSKITVVANNGYTAGDTFMGAAITTEKGWLAGDTVAIIKTGASTVNIEIAEIGSGIDWDLIIRTEADFDMLDGAHGDFPKVLVRSGTYNLSTTINLSLANVKWFIGEEDVTINNTDTIGIKYDTLPTAQTHKYKIENIAIQNATNSGFYRCLNLTNCRSANNTIVNYSECKNLTNCVSTGGGESGYATCQNVQNCLAENMNSLPSVWNFGQVSLTIGDIRSSLVAQNGDILVFDYSSDVVHISEDNGQTWSQVSLTMGNVRTSVRAQNGNILLFDNSLDVVHISSNNGQTWSQVSLTMGTVYSSIVTLNGAILAFDHSLDVVHISSNNGQTWSQVSLTMGTVQTSVRAPNGDILVFDYGSDVVHISEDNGQTWSQVSLTMSNVFTSLVASNSDILVFDDVNNLVHISSDNGQTWSSVALTMGFVYTSQVAQNGNILAFDHLSDLVHISDDNGVTWSNVALSMGDVQTSVRAQNGDILAFDSANDVAIIGQQTGAETAGFLNCEGVVMSEVANGGNFGFKDCKMLSSCKEGGSSGLGIYRSENISSCTGQSIGYSSYIASSKFDRWIENTKVSNDSCNNIEGNISSGGNYSALLKEIESEIENLKTEIAKKSRVEVVNIIPNNPEEDVIYIEHG
jgi:hypothetical protein